MEQQRKSDLELLSINRNALMGIATIIICVFHEFLPVMPEGILYDIESFVLRVSFYGVDIFLLLSGISVSYSLLKDCNIGRFYAKRAIRILPVYILAGIIMIFKAGWSILDFFLNITGISFFTTSVNSFLWFMVTIILFYLLAPFYQKIIDRCKNLWALFGVSFAIWYAVSFGLSFVIRSDLYYMINRIPIFMLGMIIGNLIKRGYEIKYKVLFWVAVFAMFIMGWFLSYSLNYYSYLFIYGRVLRFAPTMFLGFSVAMILAKLLSFIKWKPLHVVLEFMGAISLEMYIVGQVIDADLHYFLRGHDIWGVPRNILMFVIITAVSYVVMLLFKLIFKGVKAKLAKE